MTTENTTDDVINVDQALSSGTQPELEAWPTEDPVLKTVREKQRAQNIKYALTALAVFSVMGAAAYGVFSGSSEEKEAVIEGSNISKPSNKTNALSAEETARRAQADSKEAQQAQINNNSFASDATLGTLLPPNANFGIQGASIAAPPLDLGSKQPIVQQAPQPANNQNLPDPMTSLNAALSERDKEVGGDIQKFYDKLVENFLDPSKNGSSTSGYKRVSYVAKQPANATSVQSGQATNLPTSPTVKKTAAVKAGKAMYVVSDTAVNTDSGSTDTFATVIGGEYNGARLIGSVKQGQGNIAIVYTTLAPQDGRESFPINAVALKADNMSQSVADDVYNHTFTRYTSLAVASLLSGYGKVASQQSGTTVTNGNTTVSTTNPPTNKEILGGALGELGTSAATEIKRGFDRKPTYVTNAGAQFVVIFTKDAFIGAN